MLKKIIFINCILIVFSNFSFAEIINDINVFGNKRISKESIMVFGNIDLKKDYNENNLNDILKDIYQSNFFKEVTISIDNSILNINVVENPIIDKLDIKGIKSKNLKKLINEKISLKQTSPFVKDKFLSDINLIKNIVKANGYYFSEI